MGVYRLPNQMDVCFNGTQLYLSLVSEQVCVGDGRILASHEHLFPLIAT